MTDELDAILDFAPPGASMGMPTKFVAWCEWVGHPLTPGQARLARVAFDGEDPDPCHPIDRALFGDTCIHVPDSARREIALRLGRGSGKSHICGAYGVFRMVTGDTSLCGPGDYPAVGVSSVDKEEAASVLAKALAIVREKPELNAMLRNPRATGFHLVRPDGVRVRFMTRVTSAKGKGGRGPSWLLFVIDEAEFVDPGGVDAVARVEDLAGAAAPRLLPGGAIVLCSTPWPAESYVSKLFDANHGHPLHALCVLGPTLLLRDTRETREARDKAMAKDPAKALREYDCVESDVAGAFFEATTVDAAVSATTPRARHCRVSAGIDLAFVQDSAGAIHVERQTLGAKVMLVVTHVDLQTPQHHDPAVDMHGKPNGQMAPSKLTARFVNNARDAGAHAVITDGFHIQSVREHAANPDVAMQVVAAPTKDTEQSEAAVYLRDLFREGLILLPNDARLVGQIKSVLAKALPGGKLKAVLPRRAGTGHADLFAALRNAAWYDKRHGPLLRGADVAANAGAAVPETIGTGWSVE